MVRNVPIDPRPSFVAIALGSNLDDRLAQMNAARRALIHLIELERCSPLYETPPWGGVEQPPFLNAVCVGQTTLDPQTLLRALKTIEQQLGRQPGVRWGPRLIDLDLLCYVDLVLDSPVLTLPHPRLHERAFVLVPLADVAPNWRHPRLDKTVRELLAGIDQHDMERFPMQWSD